jgi:hypothetical protein
MKPYHYGKETRLQGEQLATAAKRTVSPTGRLVRRATPETDGGHMAAIAHRPRPARFRHRAFRPNETVR